MIGEVANCFTYSYIGTFTSYVDAGRLHIVDMQTQHGQIEAISLTCFNLNKASVLPVHSLARSLAPSLSLSPHMNIHKHTSVPSWKAIQRLFRFIQYK